MVKATMQARMIFAVLPNRFSNSSGMEVMSYLVPMREILPEIPEKINMPMRYGKAVVIAMVPKLYAFPARPISPLPPMIVAQTVAIRMRGPKERPAT